MTDARRLKMPPPPVDELFARSVGREGHSGKGRATDGTTRRAVRGRHRPGQRVPTWTARGASAQGSPQRPPRRWRRDPGSPPGWSTGARTTTRWRS